MDVKSFDYIKALVSPKLQKNWRYVQADPKLQEESTCAYSLMGASSAGKIVKETVEALWNEAMAKQSDGGTFRTSGMYQMLQDGALKIPKVKCLPLTNKEVPFVFLGDDAYPLLEHVMKPYNNENLLPDEEMYDKRHSGVWKPVECSFGILYSKWRIFSKAIETGETTADNIIKCCCISQNTIIDKEGAAHHLKKTLFPSQMTFLTANSARGRQSLCAQQVVTGFILLRFKNGCILSKTYYTLSFTLKQLQF
ncbi:hypothetical protein J437_LFUL015155 [Ladona fulva]|uniref:DDE Tnp4 domain-containing protein n=1 Tax=Ladona fulva TaxID=123851 RepID=A0A8K0KGN0_LADFU|nr:hypothetical protein J437_LFUL015155 [Ladona fulva]